MNVHRDAVLVHTRLEGHTRHLKVYAYLDAHVNGNGGGGPDNRPEVTFPVNRAAVSPEAQALIDEAVARFKAENRGVYFEIEGHTDSTGPAEYNEKLGYDRAVAVRNYIHDQHGIALNRMEVISYGEAKPVEDNKTRAHRAENRRVVIKVLE